MTPELLKKAFGAWLDENLHAQKASWRVRIERGAVTVTHEDELTDDLDVPEAPPA